MLRLLFVQMENILLLALRLSGVGAILIFKGVALGVCLAMRLGVDEDLEDWAVAHQNSLARVGIIKASCCCISIVMVQHGAIVVPLNATNNFSLVEQIEQTSSILSILTAWTNHRMHVERCHQLTSRFIIKEALTLLDLIGLVQRMRRMRMLLIPKNIKEFAICPLEQLLNIQFDPLGALLMRLLLVPHLVREVTFFIDILFIAFGANLLEAIGLRVFEFSAELL